jgi:ubiquinone/menaquinone biosynthesis C-methylase UbiE
VLGQDIFAEVIVQLGQRLTRGNWENVSVKLGSADDPKLPDASFDRVLMVHMYHEIAEPYAFLWRLYPALKQGGEVIVVDMDRPTQQHGTPLALLRCEFEAVGFRLIGTETHTAAGGYLARFSPGGQRPAPEGIKPCRLARGNQGSPPS